LEGAANVILPILLVAGTVLWMIGALLDLYFGGFTDIGVGIICAAFFIMPVGIFVLWPDMKGQMITRAGLIATAIGMALFAYIYFFIIGTDIHDDPEIASQADYITASILTGLGVIVIGAWLFRQTFYPRWMGYIFIGGTFVSLIVSFVPVPQSIQAVSNLALAATLCELALRAHRRKKGGTGQED
jgi:Domain of unknown function (DUF4386)